MKNISILGATGSIGTQALEVIAANPGLYKVSALTAQANARLLIEQALKYRPGMVVIGDESLYLEVKSALGALPIKVLAGEDALCEAASITEADLVLTAVMGSVGLKPTIAAIKAGKDIGLANKETLVVAGDLITRLAREHGVKIIPVDSEHSAIFQCLIGEAPDSVEKIYLTASGGPFRGKDLAFLAGVTKAQALKHPNWVMGAKITIDSASLMNKGLEVIEAKWLFGLEADQIDVIVHPQSIVHSLVQFNDGSIKAQMGLPDMKLPIHYALAYPERISSDFKRFSFMDYPELTFSQADSGTFRNLELAYSALRKGGNMACIVNAANEIVVNAFLNDQIGFLQMSEVIEACMEGVAFIAAPTLNNYLETDQHTRIFANQLVTKQVLNNQN
ncbi:1-deoxy-D-xylulose-5-phosphate reductoisomerase [Pedobacter psychroterrae]|uniref:1-deoxy-D-xylulose 5-phosphate reductoisomerase n=1 Tax=Pedobacter psychroterrae TaxID=2530453 RepID=A0A4R0NP21_9SPHI|nr:1-deoxy-D-xylulose-5-phosphate reductoisomerase [Pedobacter psychroterrae]TCD00945.1 1-deoxy-D-xylulose-5-phosphate reductoisomerase [Pedobacter psychroterrae]